MVAITASGRETPLTGTETTNGPVAAATRIPIGGMAAINTAGYIVPASADRTLTVLGVCMETVPKKGVDISTTTAGQYIAAIDQRRGLFTNSAGADAITESDRGRRCYVVFDNQVALTDNGGLRPMAGWIESVSANGVWVSFDKAPLKRQGELVASVNITTDDLVTAGATETIALLASAPPGIYVVWAVLDEVFAGGAISAVTIDVGDAGNPDLLADAVNVFTGATVAYGPLSGDGGPNPAIHNPAGTLQVVVTATGANVTAATTGDITIELWRLN